MLCTEAIIVKTERTRSSAKLLYCRSWQCETCRPRRARELIARAIKGKATRFLTLTVNPNCNIDPETRCRYLIKAWRDMRRELCKFHGYKSIPFFAVVEAQKSGEPHLHIMCRAPFMSLAIIRYYLEQNCGAQVVDLQEVTSRRKLANYVAKYCGKDPHRFGSCKRYWTSQDWMDKEPKVETTWLDEKPAISKVDTTLEEQVRFWRLTGHKVIFRRPWAIALRPDDDDFDDALHDEF